MYINRHITSVNALRIRIRSHDSSYSCVAVNFHAWTRMTKLNVVVAHIATWCGARQLFLCSHMWTRVIMRDNVKL